MASTTEILDVRLDRLLPNPHRDIANYPINPDKVDALVRSMQHGQIGMWPSIIARPHARGFEKAFGHHRQAAAEKLRLPTIPVIVMRLSDEQMLQYMGRENSEDFGTNFAVLLNTWEAADRFFRARGKNPEAIDIARLLGWVVVRGPETKYAGHETMTRAAEACNAAYRLIVNNHMERDEFDNMSTSAARDIAQRTMSMMDQVERSAKASGESPHIVSAYKSRIGHGARRTAQDVRKGDVAPREIKKELETNIYRELGKGKTVPQNLVDKFAFKLAGDINTVLRDDALSAKLAEIEKVADQVVLNADHVAIGAVQGALGELGKRAADWHRRLNTTQARDVTPGVVPLLGNRRGD